MKISLVIPCYNEAANLRLLLERCKLVTQKSDAEVILVDNGSTDDTREVLKQLLNYYPGCRSIRIDKNQGYGFGILSGLRAAKGEILAWTHADLQTDPQDTLAGLEMFDDHGTDLFVKGRRYGRPLGDRFFTVAMSVFETTLLRAPLWDINAQPTMFSRAFFETWDEPPLDFSLDLYAYYQARRASLTVRRFPVRFGERAYGMSHWNIDWRSKLKFIRRTAHYSMALRKNLKK
jgi:glycosyltransferase involved in cell wall biosynthesis